VSFSGDIQDPPGQGPVQLAVGDPASGVTLLFCDSVILCFSYFMRWCTSISDTLLSLLCSQEQSSINVPTSIATLIRIDTTCVGMPIKPTLGFSSFSPLISCILCDTGYIHEEVVSVMY